MPLALDLAKSGLRAFVTAKETATAVMHPAQWVKDRLVEALASALLAAFKATIGPQEAQAALNRLNVVDKTFPFSLDVPVPAQAASLLDGEGLLLARDVANEALAGPLELLGYRLGRVDARYDAEARRLFVDFEAGLMATGTPVAALAMSSATPALELASRQEQEDDLPSMSPSSTMMKS